METLAALSLASAVAQFLGFGAKVFETSRNIQDFGSTVSVARLRDLAHDLREINSGLTAPIIAIESAQLSKEETDLLSLARQCGQLAEELQDCLDELIPKTSHRGWASLTAAVLSVWSESRIAKLVQQLGEYRSQLTLRLLVVLNSRGRLQDERLSDLERTGKEIVEAVTVNYRSLATDISRRHAETVTAILTTRDLDARLIHADGTGKYMRDERGPVHSATFSSGMKSFVIEGVNYTKVLQDALHFREIGERSSTISEIHNDTFQWVWSFSEPGEVVRWDNLKEWLEEGKGLYWLAGKAGSGKSSLMKYLQSCPKTTDALRRWSGSSQLIVGSFYFWYAGNDLQKSQFGLLRSLLLHVLNARPDLCLNLFPDLCRSLLSGKIVSPTSLQLTHAEVRNAFATLISSVPEDVKIFFFIDGLDEYVGDMNDICDLFSQAASSPSIKILTSSRPIPVCIQKLGGLPKLYLQDLTKNNIHKYTRDKLGSNSILQGMEIEEPGLSERLVSSVASKASGVFLWVVLVVQRLTVCLQNYGTMEELETEIQSLPEDLEQLYEHMLGSQSEAHQLLGSKYLQLLLRSLEMNMDLTLLQLSFAESDNYDRSIHSPVKPLATEAFEWRCQATEGRLRSRCCGLIETVQLRSEPSMKCDKSVVFFHRTVVEFLQLRNNWSRLVILTQKTPFNAEIALVSSALAELKSSRTHDGWDHSYDTVQRIVRMLRYERNLHKDNNLIFHGTYLHEFERTIHIHWHQRSLFSTPEEQLRAAEVLVKQASTRFKMVYPTTFFMSCLLCTPVMNLQQEFNKYGIAPSKDYQITSAHMVTLFVDETDSRIRRSLAPRVLQQISHELNMNDVNKALKGQWIKRWKFPDDKSFHLESLNLWQYFLYYIFVVVRLPNSPEAQAVFSSADMILSMLEATRVILSNVVTDYDYLRLINLTWSDKRGKFSATILLAELLSQCWIKATSSPIAFDNETLALAAKHSTLIETIICRRSTEWSSYSSITIKMVGSCNSQAAETASKTVEGKKGLRKLFRLKKKTARSAPEPDYSVHLSGIFRTPWRQLHEGVPSTVE